MYFLEIENFKGSTLRTEIQSWSSGPGNPPAGGGGTGAPRVSERPVSPQKGPKVNLS